MKWSQPADRKVVEAVVASFGEPAERLQPLFSTLSPRQWQQSYYWLDASGIALYFLAHIEVLKLEKELPSAVATRLRQNLADNRNRSASLWEEYVELNRAFQDASIAYCNLKGFTLSPDSCPDPVLRCQLDLDFLVDGTHLEACRTILAERGYILRGSTSTVWEFKNDGDRLADITDFYKPKQQRCVEIHFKCSDQAPYSPVRDERLDRIAWRAGDGILFPMLSSVEQFIGQANHLFQHLCSPSTRLSWLLELKQHIAVHAEDRPFWNQVSDQIARNEISGVAVGVSALLVEDLFGTLIPPLLEEIADTRVPEGVALWVQQYGRRALLADFPGTKLYLLLREQVQLGNSKWRQDRRKALLPSRRAPRIVHLEEGAGATKRLRGELHQLRYDLFRLRFHLVEGFRYTIEAARWRRFLKQSTSPTRQNLAVRSHTAAKHS